LIKAPTTRSSAQRAAAVVSCLMTTMTRTTKK
jgi:hypothetical protein